MDTTSATETPVLEGKPLRSLTIAYASAHFGKSIFWYGSESLFAFLLTEVAQLGPASVGWVLCGSFLLSALLDVVVGVLLKRRLSSAVSAAHLQFMGALATSAALIFLFAVPTMRPEAPLALSAIAILLFRIAYAFIDIPQNAMLSSAVGTIADRAYLAAARLAGSGLAALTVAGTVASLVYSVEAMRAPLLLGLGVFMAILTVGACALLYFAVREDGDRPACPAQASDSAVMTFGRKIDPLAWLLIAAMFITSFASPVFTKLLPYYAASHLLDPVLGTITISLISVGMVLGQPFWLRALKDRSGTMKITVTCLSISVTAGLFAAAGTGAPWSILPAALLFGVSSGGVGTALWSAYGDVIAETGAGGEGVAYGLFTASAKLSLAISAAGIGLLLEDASFREVTSSRLLFGMTLPAIIAGLLTVLLLLLWRRRWELVRPAA
ncbi:MFS transporter [Sphingobium fuliginis]|uniref:Sugar transporter n=1 Tax=Sphingobium fuliginis (strain ATCC 27551) TaxID=336203 RepID=A0A292ZJ34_SPHSA|nr:MFS transporter [Sphingobium fuliginis]GAY22795.1 sugar transporter [Sphingobium fuliginis]